MFFLSYYMFFWILFFCLCICFKTGFLPLFGPFSQLYLRVNSMKHVENVYQNHQKDTSWRSLGT